MLVEMQGHATFFGLNIPWGRGPALLPIVLLFAAGLTNVCAAAAALSAKDIFFQPSLLQRGGLLVLDGVAYASFGSNSSGCGNCEHLA